MLVRFPVAVDRSTAVIETFQATEIDPSRCIIHGGAVLALLGLRDANDLDALLEPTYFNQILQEGSTPGGLQVVGEETIDGRQAFRSEGDSETGILPLDAGTFKGVFKSPRFRHHLKLAHQVDSAVGPINIISPYELLDLKRCAARQSSREIHATDVTLLSDYLLQQQYEQV